MDENKTKGATQDAVGKVKDAAGDLTGNVGWQAEGKVDQAAGRVPVIWQTRPLTKSQLRLAMQQKPSRVQLEPSATKSTMPAHAQVSMWGRPSSSSRCCRL